jgi:signal transduction histidine kinase
MPSTPGPLVRLVAPDDAVSAAVAALLSSLPGAPHVQRFSRVLDAIADPPPDLLVLDEVSVAAGDAAALRAHARARAALRTVALLDDGLGAGRGLVASGAVPLLKPVVLEELVSVCRRLLEPSAAPPPREPGVELAWTRGLADELATPLATVSGYMQLLASEPANEPQAQRYDAIREGLERLRRTVESLRAAGGSRRPRPHRGNLTAIALERAASAPAVGRMVCRSSPPVAALVDEAIAAQVIDAVLDFALRATPGVVELSTDLDGSDAVVRIELPRPSIPAEMAARLFEPYALEEPASGLLLAEARGLTRAHGGEAHAQLRDGHLAIELRFPAAQE